MDSAHDSENHAVQLHAWIEEANALASLQASALANCELCRTQLEELLALRESLDKIGAEERLGLTESKSTSGSLKPGHVLSALRGVEPALRSSQRRLSPLWILVAAAAAILLIVQPFARKDDAQPAGYGPALGGASTHLGEPIEHGDPWDQFRWVGPHEEGVSYRVVVYSSADRKDEHAIGRSSVIFGECVWNPEPDQLVTDGLEAIWWTVEVYGDDMDMPVEFWSSPRVER